MENLQGLQGLKLGLAMISQALAAPARAHDRIEFICIPKGAEAPPAGHSFVSKGSRFTALSWQWGVELGTLAAFAVEAVEAVEAEKTPAQDLTTPEQ